ncbi:hypothetical protein NDU88_002103 [Pleurodeles waltl]|uniref:Uncharacterized protein n=1 Tax=Pleurodeles waltl TaxID=8319 RepID=A0AAV7SAX3_PLEWA|nr:hypothetical protein NDU88_002103 [Pleurodeles waltl]
MYGSLGWSVTCVRAVSRRQPQGRRGRGFGGTVSRWWVRRRSGSGAWSTVNNGGYTLIELQLRGPTEGSKDFAIACSDRSHLRGFCSRPHLFWAPEGSPGFQVPLIWSLFVCPHLGLFYFQRSGPCTAVTHLAHRVSQHIALLTRGGQGALAVGDALLAPLSPPGEFQGSPPCSLRRFRPGGHAAGDAPLGLPGRRTGRRPPGVSLSPPGGFLGRLPSRRRGRRAVPVYGLRHGQRPFSQPRVARTPLTSPGDPEGPLRRGIPFRGFLAARAGLGGSPLLGGSDAAAPDQRRRVCVWRSPGHQAPRLRVRVAPPHQFAGARAPRSSAGSSSLLTAPRAPSIYIRGQIVQYRSPRGGPAPTTILAFGPRLTNGV